MRVLQRAPLTPRIAARALALRPALVAAAATSSPAPKHLSIMRSHSSTPSSIKGGGAADADLLGKTNKADQLDRKGEWRRLKRSAWRRRLLGYKTDLPRQPVPTLRETVAKLVHFAKPVQSPAAFKETLRLALEFEHDDKAQKLQQLLEERAKKLPNWVCLRSRSFYARRLCFQLTPWWLNVAYLEARTPLPIVTSPGITLEHFPFRGEAQQLEYAAKVIYITLHFHSLVQRFCVHVIRLRNQSVLFSKSLKQDGTAKTPFDMSQYENLIGTTRLPRRQRDELVYGHQRSGKHIFVTRAGHVSKSNA